MSDTDDTGFLLDLNATTTGEIRRARAAKAAAAAMVQRYAPGAPLTVQAEAVLRCAGWLLQVRAGAERQSAEGNTQSTRYFPPGRSALRSSGAMALLSPWKVRRAL